MVDVDSIIARYRKPAQLLIDGRRVPAQSGELLPVMNPAKGEQLTEVHAAGAADVDAAVSAARGALVKPTWRDLSPADRGRLLWTIGDLIERNTDELALTESLNNGKTLNEAQRGDLPPSAEIFRYYAGFCDKVHGKTIPVSRARLVYTLKQPIGVCGQIVPWNYPLLMAAWKIAPALAAGNTVVLKPSEWTPLTALRLGEICLEAGVPPGVVNVVPGLGDPAGEAISRHAGVDKIAFTGSIRTARRLLHASADTNLKRVSLELGGKSPLVALDDANLDEVVNAAFWGIFANKGEVCSASSRLIAHRSIKAELVSKLADKARSMKVGDPLDASTEMGAQVHDVHLARVLGYIDRAKKDGARVAAGGARIESGELGRGYYIQPTVFDDVEPGMEIAREEVFGPVLSVLSFEDEGEAVAVANGTAYGLVSAVFTRDVARAHRFARDIEAGTVWINLWNGFDSSAPFGGFKQSGWGREMGDECLEHYTETKTVWVQL